MTGSLGLKFDREKIVLVKERMDQLLHRMEDLEVINAAIGDYLVKSVQNRILISKTSPSGEKWEPLRPSTVEIRNRIGNILTSSILFASGELWRSIHVEQVSNSEVRIKSSAEYAAYMQFGVERVGGFMAKSGASIPARPFFGYSEANKKKIKSMLNRYLRTGEV